MAQYGVVVNTFASELALGGGGPVGEGLVSSAVDFVYVVEEVGAWSSLLEACLALRERLISEKYYLCVL